VHLSAIKGKYHHDCRSPSINGGAAQPCPCLGLGLTLVLVTLAFAIGSACSPTSTVSAPVNPNVGAITTCLQRHKGSLSSASRAAMDQAGH